MKHSNSRQDLDADVPVAERQTGQGDLSISLPIQLTIRIGNPVPVTREANQAVGGAAESSVIAESPNEHEFFGRGSPDYSLQDLQTLFKPSALQSEQFAWETVLAAAVASKVVYFQPATIKSLAQHWGLSSCRFIEGHHTQCFIAATSRNILVCFRGTEPILADWLGNLSVIPVKRDYGKVHSGFLNGFLAVKRQLDRQLEQMPNLPVLVTGHSLGGALSVIAAAEWHGVWPVEAVYTFGQPAVGKAGFAAFIEKSYENYFRIVNDDDVVPRVPPTYRHCGELFHFDAAGQLESFSADSGDQETPMLSASEFERLQACCHFQLQDENEIVAESAIQPELEGLLPSVSDHSMDRYIDKIAARV